MVIYLQINFLCKFFYIISSAKIRLLFCGEIVQPLEKSDSKIARLLVSHILQVDSVWAKMRKCVESLKFLSFPQFTGKAA